MKRIYLDHGATTPLDKEVFTAMQPYFLEKYGNPSSIHSLGQEAADAVRKARAVVAKSIGAKPEEVYFTSGGTEANNWALKGTMFANKGKHLIISAIEHDCILNSAKWLEEQGYEVTYLSVDAKGFVKLGELERSIRKDTVLVSIIHGNNEIGTIQDLDAISKICKKNKVLLHIDACQSFTKVPIDAGKVDMITINAHKIYGPKGIGALYIKSGTKISPWQHGGGHEKGLRSGTENVPGIVGFAKAVEIDKKLDQIKQLQKYFWEQLQSVDNIKLNGADIGPQRLGFNLNVTFRNLEGEAMLTLLDDAGIAVSTGSACSFLSLDDSHVLKAIGLNAIDAHGAIRFTLGKDTAKEDIDYTVEAVKKAVKKLRGFSLFR